MPAKDLEQRRATVRAWYARTKHRSAELRRASRLRRKRVVGDWYAELKSSLVCARCREAHPACMQFHHADASAKEMSISDAIRRRWGRARILLEVSKCEVLCANCHAKHHARESQR
jgi:hypothetical protein